MYFYHNKTSSLDDPCEISQWAKQTALFETRSLRMAEDQLKLKLTLAVLRDCAVFNLGDVSIQRNAQLSRLEWRAAPRKEWNLEEGTLKEEARREAQGEKIR